MARATSASSTPPSEDSVSAEALNSFPETCEEVTETSEQPSRIPWPVGKDGELIEPSRVLIVTWPDGSLKGYEVE